MGIVRTAEWLLKAPPDASREKMREALEEIGSDVQADNGRLIAETKRSIRKNRWGAKLDVSIDAAPEGRSVAVVRVDMAGNKHYELLDALAERIENLIDDRGLTPAVERLGKFGRFFGRREIRLAQHMLHADEQVLQLGQGTYGGKQGIVILTSRRLMFFEKSWAAQTVEEFPIQSISSVSVDSKRRGEKLKIHASGNVSEIEGMWHGHGDELARQVRKLMEQRDRPESASAAAPSAPATSAAERLKQLAELRDAGVLTQEEFDAKKAELIAQL